MPISRSTGLVDFVASKGSVRQALSNCRVLLFGGTAPTGAGAADTGSGGASPLCTLTLNSGAFTAEILPKWRFTMAGSSGSVDSVKIGDVELLPDAVAYTSSLSNTAALVVAAINNNTSFPDYTAQVTGAGSDEVAIYGPVGCGADLNALVLAVTATTLAVTEVGSGAVETSGAACVNGCNWGYVPSTGQISKESTVWSGVVGTTGTATWFMIATDNDAGTGSSTTARRIIGSVGTSGADLNLSSVALTQGASVSVNSWTLTVSR